MGGGVLHYAKPLKYFDWDKAVITGKISTQKMLLDNFQTKMFNC